MSGYLWCALRLFTAQISREMALVGGSFLPSDLYVPWLGAKALLSGVSPYTPEFAAELHRHIYGRVVLPSADFQNIAAFQYPPFVVVLLLPLLVLPFEFVRWLSAGLLAVNLAGAAVLWLRLVRPGSRPALQLVVAGGALLFFPSLQTLILQQPSGLVIFLVAGAAVLAARERYLIAGLILGLAMLKPQVATPAALALLFWSLTRRDRWALTVSFGVTIAALFAVAFALLPDWPSEFLVSMGRYRAYNSMFWMPDRLFGPVVGATFSAALVALLMWRWWRSRHLSLASPTLTRLFSLTCASTVVLMPDVSFYNRALLLLPIVSLLFDPQFLEIVRRAARRVATAAIALPILLLATAAALLALGPETDVVRALLSASEASLLILPVLLLPPFILTRPGASLARLA